jgi:hypothetical protein
MKIKLLFSAILLSFSASAQIGGQFVYQFLNIPASARVAALGGTLVSVKDNDPNTALQAPSLINSSMNGAISLSAVSYPDKVKFGDASYVQDFGKTGTFMATMHYVNYGNFNQTDDYGNSTGTFKAADYALTMGWGYQLNPLFSVGAAIKGIYSDYYIYNAMGVATDISATMYDSLNQWTVTLLIRNVGAQVNKYVPGNNEPLPAEALIGASKRLQHTPLRFNITYRHLQKMDLAYTDENDLGDVDPLTGEASVKDYNFFNRFSRHFILGAEILLSKNFHVRTSYNFQRRREMVVSTRPGLAGFSVGLGLKISKFIISYGFGNYHLAGGVSHFSISTSLSEFTKK